MVTVERMSPVNDDFEIATSCRDCYAIGTLATGEKMCAVMVLIIPDPDNIPEWCPCQKVN